MTQAILRYAERGHLRLVVKDAGYFAASQSCTRDSGL
jgi:hypothetical protein